MLILFSLKNQFTVHIICKLITQGRFIKSLQIYISMYEDRIYSYGEFMYDKPKRPVTDQ